MPAASSFPRSPRRYITPLSPVEYRSTRPPALVSLTFSSISLLLLLLLYPFPTLFPPSEPRDGIVSQKAEIVASRSAQQLLITLSKVYRRQEREEFSAAKRRWKGHSLLPLNDLWEEGRGKGRGRRMHAYQIRLHVWKGSNHLPGGEGYFRDGMRSKKRAVCGEEAKEVATPGSLPVCGSLEAARSWSGTGNRRFLARRCQRAGEPRVPPPIVPRENGPPFTPFFPILSFLLHVNKHRTGSTNPITIEALIGLRCVNYDGLFRRCYRRKNVCTSFRFHVYFIFSKI